MFVFPSGVDHKKMNFSKPQAVGLDQCDYFNINYYISHKFSETFALPPWGVIFRSFKKIIISSWISYYVLLNLLLYPHELVWAKCVHCPVTELLPG